MFLALLACGPEQPDACRIAVALNKTSRRVEISYAIYGMFLAYPRPDVCHRFPLLAATHAFIHFAAAQKEIAMGLIWTKIMIALRGHGHDVSDTVMANQALRLVDQAVREAEESVDAGRSSLANLMTKHILASREAEQTALRLAELTGNAEQAVALGHDRLALELAAHIGRCERVQVEDTRVAQQYARNVETLRLSLESGENALHALKQQIETLRLNMNGRASLPASDALTRLQAAADALDAICKRQKEVAAQVEAGNQLCARDPRLEKLLREPVIIPDECSAHAVLARIKSAPQSLPGTRFVGDKAI